MALACAYEAASPLDAALVAGVLQQAGIDSRVFGQSLSGGVGELPAQGLVRVMEEGAQLDQAREIVAQWQTHIPDEDALAAASAQADTAAEETDTVTPARNRSEHWPEWAFLVLMMLTGALIARLFIGN